MPVPSLNNSNSLDSTPVDPIRPVSCTIADATPKILERTLPSNIYRAEVCTLDTQRSCYLPAIASIIRTVIPYRVSVPAEE